MKQRPRGDTLGGLPDNDGGVLRTDKEQMIKERVLGWRKKGEERNGLGFSNKGGEGTSTHGCRDNSSDNIKQSFRRMLGARLGPVKGTSDGS